MTYGLVPGMTSQQFIPDQLIAGNMHVVTRSAELASGQNLTRGTLLGMITSIAATSTTGGSNVGNATIGTLSPDGVAVPGAYVITALTAGPAATWSVISPTGSNLGTATTGIPFNGPGLGFLITVGGTATATGDTFTVTLPAGSFEVTQWAPAASNGSQNLFGILADSVNASSAATQCLVYATGEFNENSVIFPTGNVLTEATRASLRALGIHLKKAIAGDVV